MKKFKAGTWVKNTQTKQTAIVGWVKTLRYTKAKVHFIYQFDERGRCVSSKDILNTTPFLRVNQPPYAGNWYLVENVLDPIPNGIELGATCALVSIIDDDSTVFIGNMKVSGRFATQINNALLTAA